ncbi:MAG: hypothetical protein WBO31_09145 [Saprospiraceae bacterium]|nr:hypothetical protein [Saprospiraceae bacterium]
MPIPDFNTEGLLPPYLDSPLKVEDLSPYKCTIQELCERYCNTSERVIILTKFLLFRRRMRECGVLVGFQWINGSFVENIEGTEKRPPNDIDVITFYEGSSKINNKIETEFPEFTDIDLSKKNYKVDHYIVDFSYNPIVLIDHTRYWSQLFTHKRNNIWKGILQVSLGTQSDDEAALTKLSLK